MPSTVWNQNMGLAGGVREGLSCLRRRYRVAGRLQRVEYRLSRLPVLGAASRRPMCDQDITCLCVVADDLNRRVPFLENDPDRIVPPAICCHSTAHAQSGGPT